MIVRAVPIHIDGVELLVETVAMAGTEPTSALDRVQDAMTDGFDRAKSTILAVGRSVVDILEQLSTSPATRPNSMEIEFGLSFTATGNVIMAGATAQAALKVRITYGED